MRVIKYGKFSCTEAALKGSFENVQKRLKHVPEVLLRGAYDQVKQEKVEKKKD